MAPFLPLTFVDNCAEAIVLAGLKASVDGEIFNVVDDELLSGRQFLDAYKKKVKSFDQSGFLTSLVTACVLYGRNIRNGPRISFPLSSMVAAVPLSGREIATPIRSSKNVGLEAEGLDGKGDGGVSGSI